MLAIALVICLFVVRNIYSLLAQNEPVGARVLVIEGWLAPEELDQAIQTYKKGGYERIVTTGGPISGWPELSIHSNYAKVAADYLAQHGVPRNVIILVPTPASAQERTFLSAVVLRDSTNQLSITLDAIDLFSSGAHSRLLYQIAFGQKARIGVLAARPDDYDPEAWLADEQRRGIRNFPVYCSLWVKCFFWPEPPRSQQERWGAH